jgi:glycosyltransferase involved in cell wall biosynthesis
MNIWLLQSGEQLPSDGVVGPTRLMRSGLTASMLDAAGHSVTWWASTFNHLAKHHRTEGYAEMRLFSRSRVCLLPGRSYRRNVSVARLVNHWQVAREFTRRAAREPLPDVLLAAYPSVDLAHAAVQFGRCHNIPVAVDIRDLWPDIFLDAVPAVVRPLARLGISRYRLLRRQTMLRADGIWGTSNRFVDWGLDAAARPRGAQDLTFPLAYLRDPVDAKSLAAATEKWRALIGSAPQGLVFSFVGSFGERVLDLTPVIEAASLARAQGLPYTFVLCGTGPALAGFREQAKGLGNLHFPGYVDATAVQALLRMSTAGIVPYRPLWDFQMSLPNKAIEYLSTGLPIVACQGGELKRLLQRSGAGLTYDAGSPMDLLRALQQVVQPDFQLRARQAASAVFDQEFDAGVVYQRYIDSLLTLSPRR